jgi:hypothetical protein
MMPGTTKEAMVIINSIRDLINCIDAVVEVDGPLINKKMTRWVKETDLITGDHGPHITEDFAENLSSEAHDAGLRYGDDWGKFLEEHCTTEKTCEYIEKWLASCI